MPCNLCCFHGPHIQRIRPDGAIMATLSMRHYVGDGAQDFRPSRGRNSGSESRGNGSVQQKPREVQRREEKNSCSFVIEPNFTQYIFTNQQSNFPNDQIKLSHLVFLYYGINWLREDFKVSRLGKSCIFGSISGSKTQSLRHCDNVVGGGSEPYRILYIRLLYYKRSLTCCFKVA